MSQLLNNTTDLQIILETVNNLPEIIKIDDTLTQSGQAADAKAVGDALADKLDSSALADAIEDALIQAKESGDFDGKSRQLLYSGNFPDMIASAHNEIDFGFDFVVGTEYEVVFDGVSYPMVCENLGEFAMLAMGNKSIPSADFADTGEPFFLYEKTTTSELGKQYLLAKTSGAHEIEIYITVVNNNNSSNNVLDGKKILIIGDSVNSGAGWSGGFANLFAEDFPNAIVRNGSVSGDKLAGEAIYYQLVRAFQDGFMPDYILMDGGGNDILGGVSEGTVNIETYSTGGEGEEFDSATIAGAFEHFATNAQKYLPNVKIIFFNLYKMHPTMTEVSYTSQKQTWDLLRQCCEKYAIRYVDLGREGNFTPSVTEQFNAFMYDWIHINESGYRRFWPLIKNAILTA
jgi:lysophospholipase L1-like esterase